MIEVISNIGVPKTSIHSVLACMFPMCKILNFRNVDMS